MCQSNVKIIPKTLKRCQKSEEIVKKMFNSNHSLFLFEIYRYEGDVNRTNERRIISLFDLNFIIDVVMKSSLKIGRKYTRKWRRFAFYLQ